MARDTSLDQEFSLDDYPLPRVGGSLTGVWLNQAHSFAILPATVTLLGKWLPSVTVRVIPFSIGSPLIGGRWVASPSRINWVRWSAIGVLDFTITRSNVAGERPLNWKGNVWALKWLGDKIVAYGENGVSFLIPVDVKYGLRPIYPMGLRGKQAVVDIGEAHYFIDSSGQLCKLDPSLKVIGYSEYLRELTSTVVMSWDLQDRLIFICDGLRGFVFDPETSSLCRGPVNVSGIGYQNGQRYVVGPEVISTPNLEFITDIYDFGSRFGKHITSVEVGVDTFGYAIDIEVAVEYRLDKSADFIRTSWVPLDSRGIAFISCFGYEFRFHLRASDAAQFHIDYLIIKGQVT